MRGIVALIVGDCVKEKPKRQRRQRQLERALEQAQSAKASQQRFAAAVVWARSNNQQIQLPPYFHLPLLASVLAGIAFLHGQPAAWWEATLLSGQVGVPGGWETTLLIGRPRPTLPPPQPKAAFANGTWGEIPPPARVHEACDGLWHSPTPCVSTALCAPLATPCAGSTFLPSDHHLTQQARQSVEAVIEAAAALAGEQQGPEAAAALRQQFGGGRVSVQVYGIEPGIKQPAGFAGDMRLAVCTYKIHRETGTIAHEVAHVLLRHAAERLQMPQAFQRAVTVFQEL